MKNYGGDENHMFHVAHVYTIKLYNSYQAKVHYREMREMKVYNSKIAMLMQKKKD